jgi:hypothetical protein
MFMEGELVEGGAGTGEAMGKRIAGDCSRKRRFCFVQNPANAAYYAAVALDIARGAC